MSAGPSSFRSTRWTLVAAARGGTDEARRALGELCEAYWYPLYARARRRGLGDEEALDLVQGFLASLLEKGDLGGSTIQGSFRAWLLGALAHHESGRARHERAERRGGGRVLSLEGVTGAAERYRAEGEDGCAPDTLFERAWALEVLAAARRRLEEEYEQRGRGPLFAALEDTLDGGAGARSHGQRAEALGCSLGAVKVAAHRLRRRLGELVRAEVAEQVTDPARVDDEVTHLFRALGGVAAAGEGADSL